MKKRIYLTIDESVLKVARSRYKNISACVETLLRKDLNYYGDTEMEDKWYGVVTRNNGAIRTKAKNKKEALVIFQETCNEVEIGDIYQKVGETWDETTFDCD